MLKQKIILYLTYVLSLLNPFSSQKNLKLKSAKIIKTQQKDVATKSISQPNPDLNSEISKNCRGAHVLLFDEKNRCLLGFEKAKQSYSTFGGSRDKNITLSYKETPSECAYRELLEELSLKLGTNFYQKFEPKIKSAFSNHQSSIYLKNFRNHKCDQLIVFVKVDSKLLDDLIVEFDKFKQTSEYKKLSHCYHEMDHLKTFDLQTILSSSMTYLQSQNATFISGTNLKLRNIFASILKIFTKNYSNKINEESLAFSTNRLFIYDLQSKNDRIVL